MSTDALVLHVVSSSLRKLMGMHMSIDKAELQRRGEYVVGEPIPLNFILAMLARALISLISIPHPGIFREREDARYLY